jgi:hypothetical protein
MEEDGAIEYLFGTLNNSPFSKPAQTPAQERLSETARFPRSLDRTVANFNLSTPQILKQNSGPGTAPGDSVNRHGTSRVYLYQMPEFIDVLGHVVLSNLLITANFTC